MIAVVCSFVIFNGERSHKLRERHVRLANTCSIIHLIYTLQYSTMQIQGFACYTLILAGISQVICNNTGGRSNLSFFCIFSFKFRHSFTQLYFIKFSTTTFMSHVILFHFGAFNLIIVIVH